MIQYIADTFTDRLFAGNPAAVLPCRQMPAPALMQAIAIENNYSETAFVVRKGAGQYDLKPTATRWTSRWDRTGPFL